MEHWKLLNLDVGDGLEGGGGSQYEAPVVGWADIGRFCNMKH